MALLFFIYLLECFGIAYALRALLLSLALPCGALFLVLHFLCALPAPGVTFPLYEDFAFQRQK
jgi:hypothetical protein